MLPTDGTGRKRARVVFAIGLGLLGLWVAWDFLTPFAWAAVLALTLWPLYRRLAGRVSFDRANVFAPLLFTVGVGIVLFIPVALALHQIAQEGQAVAQYLSHVRHNGIPVPQWLNQMPLGDHAVRWWTSNLADPKGATVLLGGNPDAESDAGWSRSLAGQMLHRTFHFVVTLAALFALLRDGAWISNRVLDTADRLLGDPGERLASKTVDTVRGTVNGTVAVAVVEGLVIGAAYIVAGVPNPLLLALITMAFAMVPLGAWVVFSAASLLLLLQGGSVFAAAGLFGFGAAVMLIGDFFLWPAMIGNAARLPFLLAFVGIFGGLQAFGLVGLFLGPLVLAALWTVWREWIGNATSHSKS